MALDFVKMKQVSPSLPAKGTSSAGGGGGLDFVKMRSDLPKPAPKPAAVSAPAVTPAPAPQQPSLFSKAKGALDWGIGKVKDEISKAVPPKGFQSNLNRYPVAPGSQMEFKVGEGMPAPTFTPGPQVNENAGIKGFQNAEKRGLKPTMVSGDTTEKLNPNPYVPIERQVNLQAKDLEVQKAKWKEQVNKATLLSLAAFAPEIAANPLSSTAGFAVFDLISRGVSGIIKASQGENPFAGPRQGLSDVLPSTAPVGAVQALDVLQFLGEIYGAHKAFQGAPKAWDAITKKTIVENKIPEYVTVKANDVWDWQTGKAKIDPEIDKLLTESGMTAPERARAAREGVTLTIPSETITRITDRPFWAKLKSKIGLEPTNTVEVKPGEVNKPQFGSEEVTGEPKQLMEKNPLVAKSREVAAGVPLEPKFLSKKEIALRGLPTETPGGIPIEYRKMPSGKVEPITANEPAPVEHANAVASRDELLKLESDWQNLPEDKVDYGIKLRDNINQYLADNAKKVLEIKDSKYPNGLPAASIEVVKWPDGKYELGISVQTNIGGLGYSAGLSDTYYKSEKEAVAQGVKEIMNYVERGLQSSDNKGEIKILQKISEGVKRFATGAKSSKPTKIKEPKAKKEKVGKNKVLSYEDLQKNYSIREFPNVDISVTGNGKYTAELGNDWDFNNIYVTKDGQLTSESYETQYGEDPATKEKFFFDTPEEAKAALIKATRPDLEVEMPKTKESKKTQKEKVKKAVSEKPKNIKEIAQETKILEPNVRRILGVGAKEGVFSRVDKGVYVLSKDGQDIAFVHPGDALEVLPKLVEDGFKADMIFLDEPYMGKGNQGGNRMNVKKGTLYDLITTEQMASVVDDLAKILKGERSPLIKMFSQSKSSAKNTQATMDIILKAGFKPVAKGDYYKMSKKGTRLTQPMRSDFLEPEGIMIFTKSGDIDKSKLGNLQFKLVRPKGWKTEKPAELLKSLIEMTTNEGEMILDPFAGSGVTGEQAIKTGRKATLIEKNPEAVKEHIVPRLNEALKKTIEATGDKAKLKEASTREKRVAELEKEHQARIKAHNQAIIDKLKAGLTKKKKVPMGDASVGSQSIGKFEKREAVVPQKEMKLFDEVQKLVDKYARSIKEDYLPRNAQGVLYGRTQNIRTKGITDLSTAVHEISHFQDTLTKFTKQFMMQVGETEEGNPLYDRETAWARKDLTTVYTDYYPGGKTTHKLKKRLREGYATFIQKYVEMPSTMKARFPKLVEEFLTPGGKYFNAKAVALIKDVEDIVQRYQGLPELEKIGSRIMNDQPDPGKQTFMEFSDKFKTFIADDIYPVEKVAKLTGTHFTKKDASLYLRYYNNSNNMIVNNLRGSHGFWGLRNGNIVKIHDFNYKTLYDALHKANVTTEFGYYLVARDEHFQYRQLDQYKMVVDNLMREIERMQAEGIPLEGDTILADLKAAQKAMNELAQELNNNGFSRQEVDAAYRMNQERFKGFEEMYDTLKKEDLKFLADPEVDRLSASDFHKLMVREGYAPRKRFFYTENGDLYSGKDLILGNQRFTSHLSRGSGVSSLKGRSGSQKIIYNPLYTSVIDHAEITRKGLKQIVVNKIADWAKNNPEETADIFEIQQLKPVPGGKEGIVYFPQEQDPSIIMARRNGKRVPVLVKDPFLLQALDNVLSFKNIDTFKKIFLGTTRLFTKGTTAAYPWFAISNAAMDAFTVAFNTKTNLIPVYDNLKTLSKVLMDHHSAQAKYAQEYLISGGERQTFAGYQNITPNELAEALTKENKGLQRIISAAQDGVEILSMPSQWSEYLGRMQEFINARMKGDSTMIALEKAGRVSGPFHHVGTWGGDTMKTVVKQVPFFNPAIQELAQIFETLNTKGGFKSGGRGRASIVMSLILTLGLAANYLMIKNATDKQKRIYKDIQPDELANYIWLPSPDGQTLIKIRISQQLNFIPTVANMFWNDQALATRYSKGEYLDAGFAWIPNQFDPTDPTRMMLSWLDPATKAVIESTFNVRTYPKTSPLESQSMQNKEPRYRYTESTSAFAKYIGDKFNLSPVKIDNLITNIFGRTSGFVTGKPSIANPLSVMQRKEYFSSGRMMQRYFELSTTNAQEFNTLKNARGKKSSAEVLRILSDREKISVIDRLFSEYSKATDPALQETLIKTIIFQMKGL